MFWIENRSHGFLVQVHDVEIDTSCVVIGDIDDRNDEEWSACKWAQ